jgi:predicted kinase
VSDRVYAELLTRADRFLALGEPTVLDATWTDAAHRDAARALARRRGTRLLEIECWAPVEVAAERVRARLEHAEGPSDATPELARLLAEERAPAPRARSLDTHRPMDEVVRDALRAVGPW